MRPPPQQSFPTKPKPPTRVNLLLVVGALVAVVLLATVLSDLGRSDVEPPAIEADAPPPPVVVEAPTPPPSAKPPQREKAPPPEVRRVTAEDLRRTGGWSTDQLKGNQGPTAPVISSIYDLGRVCSDVQSSHWCLYSQEGDYIGAGRLTEGKGSVRVQQSGRGVRVSFGGWHASFAPRKGRTFAVGGYGNARRFASENFPELSVSGGGRGCNVVMGSFEVTRLVVYGEKVEAFEVLFEQHCEGKPDALFGRICFNCRKELKDREGLLKGIRRLRDPG